MRTWFGRREAHPRYSWPELRSRLQGSDCIPWEGSHNYRKGTGKNFAWEAGWTGDASHSVWGGFRQKCKGQQNRKKYHRGLEGIEEEPAPCPKGNPGLEHTVTPPNPAMLCSPEDTLEMVSEVEPPAPQAPQAPSSSPSPKLPVAEGLLAALQPFLSEALVSQVGACYQFNIGLPGGTQSIYFLDLSTGRVLHFHLHCQRLFGPTQVPAHSGGESWVVGLRASLQARSLLAGTQSTWLALCRTLGAFPLHRWAA